MGQSLLIRSSKKTNIDYITEGLVWYLDGINNQRTGHASSLTYWHDLSGYARDIKMNGITIDSNCITFAGTSSSYGQLNMDLNREILGSQQHNERTIEVVFQITTTGKNFIILSGNTGSYKVIGWYGGKWYDGHGTDPKYNWNWTQDENIHSLSQDYANPPSFYLDNTILTRSSADNFGTSGDVLRLSGRGSDYPFFGKIFCIRVYNRLLSAEERLYNYTIDKERFAF